MSGIRWTISSLRRPTITRNGPWVAPCCGPMLRYISVGSSSVVGRPHSSGLKRSCSCISSTSSSGSSNGPYSVPRDGCSLRSGWPSHQGGMRRRLRLGVAGDVDAEHVPDLALVPGGGGPHAGDGVDPRRARLQRDLDAHVGVPLVGDEVVEDAEAGVGQALAVLARALVDAAQVVEHGEGLGRRRAEVGEHLGGALRRHPDGRDAVGGRLRRQRHVREPLADLLEHGRRRGCASAGLPQRPLARLGRGGRVRRRGARLGALVAHVTSRRGGRACRSPRAAGAAGRASRCRAA